MADQVRLALLNETPDLKEEGQPKYTVVAGHIRAQILNGSLPEGGRLPTERELCRAFNLANHTLRRSLTLLEEEGLVRREHGRGTFITTANERLQRQSLSKVLSNKPVAVLGLGPGFSQWNDPTNLAVRHLRYQGVVESGFEHQTAVTCPEDTLLGQLNESEQIERFSQMAGIIVDFDTNGPPPLTSRVMRELTQRGVPVVTILCFEPAIVSGVVPDIYSGAAKAVEYLIRKGHKRIGFCGGNRDNVYLRFRHDAYLDTLSRHDIAIDESLLVTSPCLPNDTATAIAPLLESSDRPTAIFAASDLRAFGIMEAAKELGLRVPEDLSVIGFDDIPGAATYEPALTTVCSLHYELGQQAMALLQEELATPSRDLRIRTLDLDLVERESCQAL